GNALLRVVEAGLELGVGGGDVRLHLPDAAAERAGEPAGGVAPGRLGRGVDDVEDRLGLRQVELAVEVGAERELAGPGRTGAGREAEVEDASQHCGPAVRLELDDVLPGVGGR